MHLKYKLTRKFNAVADDAARIIEHVESFWDQKLARGKEHKARRYGVALNQLEQTQVNYTLESTANNLVKMTHRLRHLIVHYANQPKILEVFDDALKQYKNLPAGQDEHSSALSANEVRTRVAWEMACVSPNISLRDHFVQIWRDLLAQIQQEQENGLKAAATLTMEAVDWAEQNIRERHRKTLVEISVRQCIRLITPVDIEQAESETKETCRALAKKARRSAPEGSDLKDMARYTDRQLMDGISSVEEFLEKRRRDNTSEPQP